MLKKILVLVGLLVWSLPAGAVLYDRGDGLIYDDVLDITWLQDSNYAFTSGYDGDGLMNWADASVWAANLNYNSHTDWRLASARDEVNPGYNRTSGELGHMYYNNLGLTSGTTILGNTSFLDATPGGGLVNFINLIPGDYWYAEATWLGSNAFDIDRGYQDLKNSNFSSYAWAVSDGDIAAVPAPATVWLFGSALGLLAWLKHRAN